MRERVVAATMLLALAAGVAVLASGGRDDTRYAPRIDPAGFTADVTNPYLPLRAGSQWIYEGRSEDGFERKVVEVTDETRTVMGVTCVVVKDTVTLDGQLYEETFDWFAEDRAGAVWNFGEATRKRNDAGNFTPAGSYTQVVVTRDWSPLDPGVAEHKHYAPGIGLLREEAVDGDSYRVDLIAMWKRS